MTGNAINAKSEALEPRELSSEDLDAVSGGSLFSFLRLYRSGSGSQGGGQNDPAQMFQQIMQQLTQGQG
jgi:hypothetical protein